jgi:hypothetical protein
LEIPEQFEVFERSFLARRDSGSRGAFVSIDGVRISATTSVEYGAISGSQLSTGSEHKFVQSDSPGSYVISLLYTAPTGD